MWDCFLMAVSQKPDHQIPECLLPISSQGFQQVRHTINPSRGCPLGLVSWAGFSFSLHMSPVWIWSGREFQARGTNPVCSQSPPTAGGVWREGSEGEVGPGWPPLHVSVRATFPGAYTSYPGSEVGGDTGSWAERGTGLDMSKGRV